MCHVSTADGQPEHAPTSGSAAPMTRITDLFVHPLKGAAPMRVHRLRLDALGAVGDRRWVLVDEQGHAVTPREVSTLTQVVATLPLRDGAIEHDAPLTLQGRGLDALIVPPAPATAALRDVRVWDDVVQLADAGEAAADWVSRATGVSCRLMHWTAVSRRPLAAKYAGALPHDGRHVTITDGAPLLLLGSASLDALNTRLTSAGHDAIGLERFRANVVLATTAPHEEDHWERVRVGTVEIGVGSPCPRCVVTTIDPRTLAQGVEPLRTLAQYRRGEGGGVMFGMNATHAHAGELVMGDALDVLSHRVTPDR
jgi:uncharacterized protein